VPALIPPQPVSRQIPASTAPFFQEYHFGDLDAEKDAALVLERILAFGNREELSWLFSFYGREKIKVWVGENGLRRLPYRRYNMWCVLLDLPRPEKQEIGEGRDSLIKNDAVPLSPWQCIMKGFKKSG